MILPGRAKQRSEPLTPEGQFAFRSELGGLIRTSRIARRGALYDASSSALKCGEIEQVITNPIGFEEIVDVGIAKAAGDSKFAHVEGYGEFLAKKSEDANRVNLLKKIKMWLRRKLISKCEIIVLSEGDYEFKIGRRNYNLIPDRRLGGSGIAIELHCVDRGNLN